jgi:predicted acetyltransferase
VLPIRPASSDELRGFFEVIGDAFGEDFSDDEFEIEAPVAEPERTLAAFDGAAIVGTAGAFTFDLSVPGGRLPAAGVTYVSVRSTHRRRGLLASMMRRQLDDIHDRGEPIAVLWASEAAIYGRFGYGVASQLVRIEVDRVDASLRRDVAEDPSLRVRTVTPGDVVSHIEAVERSLVEHRPGTFLRDKRWIDQLVADPKSRRMSMSKLNGLLVESADGDVVGYALYRTKSDSLRPHMLPDGEVFVAAQAATTPAADVALVRTLLSLDLMRRVRWWNRPVDSSLPHLLSDARHARTTVLDGVHLRVVDLPAALTGRRYAAPVDVVVEVRDDLCPWNAGRWHLRGDRDATTCTPTEADPLLRLGIEDLGAVYLGGTTLTTLAAAGRVTASDAEALGKASVAFGWDVAPWCPVVF